MHVIPTGVNHGADKHGSQIWVHCRRQAEQISPLYLLFVQNNVHILNTFNSTVLCKMENCDTVPFEDYTATAVMDPVL